MKSVLSTKLLTASQQELLLNAGLSFSHYNAIQIEFLDFRLPNEDFDYFIFTSQNAVKAYHKSYIDLKGKAAFCVGKKTKSLLEEKGGKVIETAQNSSELGKIIVNSYKKRSFFHIGGNIKVFPKGLKRNNIRYIEVDGYRTRLNYKKFKRLFDGLLFFSPSGVRSFAKENRLNGIAFCIGDTTAVEAKKYTNKIIIAKTPTIENVIVQAVKHFNKTKKNT